MLYASAFYVVDYVDCSRCLAGQALSSPFPKREGGGGDERVGAARLHVHIHVHVGSPCLGLVEHVGGEPCELSNTL